MIRVSRAWDKKTRGQDMVTEGPSEKGSKLRTLMDKNRLTVPGRCDSPEVGSSLVSVQKSEERPV